MSLSIRRLLMFLVIIGFGTPILPGVAQSEAIPLSGNYSVVMPDGWTKAKANAHGTLFTNTDSSMTIYAPDEIASLTSDASSVDLKKLLSTVFNQTHDFGADQQAVTDTKFIDYDAAIWNYTIAGKPDFRGAFFVIKLGQEHYAALDILSSKDTFDDSMAAGNELLSSLKATQGPAVPIKGCTISTKAERSVALRVGPGTNRTSIAFLPTGVQFTVLGKSSDKSGKLWFQLDKTEVAPKSSANEVWTLSTDVTTSGDCESVANTTAPPIVPIVQAPSSIESGSGNTTSSVGTIIPQNGTWTVSFARQTNASCEGTENFVRNTNEVWIDWSESDFVQQTELLVASPDHFLFNGTVFQSTGNNHYMGSWTFGDGKNTQLYLVIVSSTSMVGQMIGNGRFSGRACSATTDMSATRS